MSRDVPEPVLPLGWPRPRGYANGMLAPAGGRLLTIAGQIAWDAEQRVVSDDFGDQFRQALANVVAVVRAAGGKPEHVMELTIYVVDRHAYLAAIERVGAAYRELMGRCYPSMALVEVRALLEDRAQVEIQGLAMLPGGSD